MSVTYVELKPNSKFDGSWSSYSTSSRISGRILGHYLTYYSTSNNGQISNIFRIVRRVRVIRRSLETSKNLSLSAVFSGVSSL